jgi:type I restriction enzyme S subunit
MSHIDDLIQELCPDGVEYRRIGDIADVGTGSSDRKDAKPDGKFPFYVRSKDVMRIDSYEFDEDAIVIPGEGGIGEIFHIVSGKYALHQRAYRISFRTPAVDTRFAYYFFAVHFKKFILQKAVSATVTSIRRPMITDFRIPVPPLEVQREIVRILDKFTALEAELEAELEARRRQYEHYRDKLLTFKERA